MAAWTDASLHDVFAVLVGAERVVIERLHPDEPLSGTNPLVPKIKNDGRLRGLAKLLLARDAQAALEAFIPWDFRPENYGGRIGFGFGHWCYGETRTNENYSIADALDQPGGAGPSSGGAGNEYFISYELDVQYHVLHGRGDGGLIALRHTCGGIVPLPISGSYSTPQSTRDLAARIYAASLAQTASDVAIDAGLAATITSNLAATRAAILARSQATYATAGMGYV